MGVCFLGFGHDASVVGNTAQETVIIAQPPESPSLSLLYLKVIPVFPLWEFMPFLLLIQTYWLMSAFKNGQLPLR